MAAKRRKKGRRSPGGRPSGSRQPVLGIVSLGCAKNTVDTERILGMFAERGWAVSADPEWADLVLVNTCAFIEPARKETEDVLRELSGQKPVVAIGCYPERMRPDGEAGRFTLKKLPNVVAFVSFEEFDRLPEICEGLVGASAEAAGTACFDESPRLLLIGKLSDLAHGIAAGL